LLIEYGEEKFCLETKILRSEKTRTDGLKQLQDYMDKCSAKEGHLIIFDRTKEKKWDTKISMEIINEKIKIWGM